MDGGETLGKGTPARVAGAAFVAVLSALGAWVLLSSSPATAGSPSGASLLPDLIVESPADVVLQGTTKYATLRFSHTTSNVGAGPLEIYPDLTTETCGDEGDRGRVAYQAIYQDSNENGQFERNLDQGTVADPVGCMIFHGIHSHYHFEDFAQYELYRMKSGLLKETSDKVSFCVFDLTRTHPDLPGSPPGQFYNFANCATDDGTHGISVGYADIYGSNTPGQEFDVSDRNPGRYCLVARTDPADRLEEVPAGGEDNNIQAVQIRLNRKNASTSGARVPILKKPCSPPTTP